VANCSSVAGMRAFLDEEADHREVEYFQGGHPAAVVCRRRAILSRYNVRSHDQGLVSSADRMSFL